MTATETTTQPEATRDEMLEWARRTTLRNIDRTAKDVAQILGGIQRDATNALAALSTGHRMAGMTLGTGPLGHQAAADLIKQTARLEALLDQARMLDIPDADIDAAYKIGA